ncbi:MAG TPA: adenine methyltransferase [Spirochaetia bacterium]|nr:adenine methyltransferase [Spirochaetia bacterium]
MKYMGSKNRHAKEILSIILKNRKAGQWYIEPFVGGFNLIDKVDGNRIGNDINFYLIELFKAIQDGWNPPSEISYNQYQQIKDNKEKYPNYLVGFVGFGCSFSGKWFGGYARGNGSNGEKRNYCLESKKNILNQFEKIKEIIILNKNYWELDIPENSIIYCDPPYEGTTKYKDDFNHEKYWNWVREMINKGHEVFCSEYTAPEDFICVWEKKVNNNLDLNTGSKQGIEKLFVHKSQINNNNQ